MRGRFVLAIEHARHQAGPVAEGAFVHQIGLLGIVGFKAHQQQKIFHQPIQAIAAAFDAPQKFLQIFGRPFAFLNQIDIAGDVREGRAEFVAEHVQQIALEVIHLAAALLLDRQGPIEFGAHDDEQIFQIDRLHQIVIGAQLLAGADVGALALGRQEDERHGRPPGLAAHLFQKLKAIHLRHHDV